MKRITNLPEEKYQITFGIRRPTFNVIFEIFGRIESENVQILRNTATLEF